jgi:GDP-L-fucose synthase
MFDAREKNAPQVKVWGTGTPKREFLHVDDLADACVFLMENYDSPEIINVGTGVDLSIRELAYLIKKEIGYEGEIVFDSDYPDGTPKKQLDTTKINGLGWSPKIALEDGIHRVCKDFVNESRGMAGVKSYSGALQE